MAMGPELSTVSTALQLERLVAQAIGLLPCRGTVLLTTSQGQTLERTDALACSCEGTTLELTAIVKEESTWPVALDGRPMPYAYSHRICNESLAFDISTVRVREADGGLRRARRA